MNLRRILEVVFIVLTFAGAVLTLNAVLEIFAR